MSRLELRLRAGYQPWTGWGAAAGVLVLAALLLLRQPLSNRLWPQTRAQELHIEAALALSQGRLTAQDGHGARELFEAALALEPDRDEARLGLSRVGSAALEQARRAVVQGRYADAHAALALARELAVPATQVGAVSAALRGREHADAGIDALLRRATAARTAGQLDGNDASALALYQRVLALQPTHTGALEGREDTLADLLQQARHALARGELTIAAALVHRAHAADSGERQRQRAAADLRRGRLPSALAGYRTVLAANPDDSEAARGLSRVAGAYAARSERLSADFRFDEATAALDQAQSIAPALPAIAQAKQHLARARQSQPRLTNALPAAERERRLRLWLKQAADAESRGDLLTPPGDSAYDKLRAAQAIAPRDRRVLQAAARLLPAADACFETELRGNRLHRAGQCLDARRVLDGDGPGLSVAQRRLAQRWIAVGNERLSAGETPVAKTALAAARALDPDAAGLDEFAERLRAAAAAD